MAEVDRLNELLKKCKTTGCTQSDVDDRDAPDNKEDNGGNNNQNQDAEKKYTGGKIKFPDCGATVSEECFWAHYKRSGWLDFLSFFCYIPALIGCAIFDDYGYGLCLGNFAYIIVDAYSKKAAPPDYALE